MKKESRALENSTFPSIELLTSFLISVEIVPGKIYGRRNSSRNIDPIVITMTFAIFLLQRNIPIFIKKIKFSLGHAGLSFFYTDIIRYILKIHIMINHLQIYLNLK